MKRREFITVIGGAAAWPLAAGAQQMPVIGFLHPGSPSASASLATGFLRGLGEAGYVEGHNVTIEYRWAQGEYARLPKMADDLIHVQVSVIAVVGTAAALAAQAATTSIPIAFVVVDDPTKVGLVHSLSRPDKNATGVNYFLAELGSKQLGLLHELIPVAMRVGLLVNPTSPLTEPVTRDAMAAAAAIGLQIDVVEAKNSPEIEAAFATLVRNRADALLVGPDAFLLSRRVQITTLATRHAIPAMYNAREYPEAGGLMSYGTVETEAFHQFGVYTGKLLKGAKPADLPVIQSTKFELVINLPTSRVLGLEIPATLLARADYVIE
jgi:putative tryptophan/tyrosine transport system substrate-binding protein